MLIVAFIGLIICGSLIESLIRSTSIMKWEFGYYDTDNARFLKHLVRDMNKTKNYFKIIP